MIVADECVRCLEYIEYSMFFHIVHGPRRILFWPETVFDSRGFRQRRDGYIGNSYGIAANGSGNGVFVHRLGIDVYF